MEAKTQKTTITVAHSPDSDDAFMFYGLATNKLETDGLKFEHTLKDIQTLNEDAKNGVFDVTAISFHAYAYVSDKYALLPHGASIGDKYGPILVSKEPRKPEEISQMKIAIPGEMTSAFLALRIYNQDFEYTVVPFDLMRKVSNCLHKSIKYSLDNREDALAYAMQFARDMPPELADRFVAMWVNDLTLDYGERGREAVKLLLEEGYEKGIIPHRVQVDFAE
jgi:1,4-dihydroxy-6-naphthoate synthase